MRFAIIAFLFCSGFASAQDPTFSIVGGKPVTEPAILAPTVGIIMGSSVAQGFCTGSYIGRNKVLTAAHCVTAFEDKIVRTHVEFIRSDKSQVSCSVKSAVAHPDWVEDVSWWADVGVMTIDCGDFDLAQVPAFELPKAGETVPWKQALIVGYGMDGARIGESSPTFPLLKEVTLKPVDSFGKFFAKTYPKFAQAMKDGRLSCFESNEKSTFFMGDSGGPSVIKQQANGTFAAVGVHSVIITASDREKNGSTEAVAGVCDLAVQPYLNWILAQ